MDMELKALLTTEYPESEAEKEFRAWLKECREILAGRDVYEVARLAIMAGFEKSVVYSILSHFQDAMTGSCTDRRIRLQIFSNLSYLDNPKLLEGRGDWRRPIFIVPLWKDLAANTSTGEVA